MEHGLKGYDGSLMKSLRRKLKTNLVDRDVRKDLVGIASFLDIE